LRRFNVKKAHTPTFDPDARKKPSAGAPSRYPFKIGGEELQINSPRPAAAAEKQDAPAVVAPPRQARKRLCLILAGYHGNFYKITGCFAGSRRHAGRMA
jgi:hypothetical protein